VLPQELELFVTTAAPDAGACLATAVTLTPELVGVTEFILLMLMPASTARAARVR
jgi:hypothetical protein